MNFFVVVLSKGTPAFKPSTSVNTPAKTGTPGRVSTKMHAANSVSAANSPQHLKQQEEPLMNAGGVKRSSCKANSTIVEIKANETNTKIGSFKFFDSK